MPKPIERRIFATELTVVESKHRSAVPTLRGYASVFNQIDGPAGAREMVAPGAFSRSLRAGDPVTALWNHNPDFVIASTKNDSLRLSEDSHGLLAEMTPIDTPTIRDLVIKPIQEGLVNKMSFGFETVKDEYTTDAGGPLRVLRDLTLFDVSPVVFPWYEGTDISARGKQFAGFLQQMDLEAAQTLTSLLTQKLANHLLTASAAPESQEGFERQAQIAGAIAADAHARRLLLLELLKKGFLQ